MLQCYAVQTVLKEIEKKSKELEKRESEIKKMEAYIISEKRKLKQEKYIH